MPRYTFQQIFRLVSPSAIEVLRHLKIGLAEFSPGEIISKGTIVAGIDFFNYINSEMEIEQEGDWWVIKRIYGRPS